MITNVYIDGFNLYYGCIKGSLFKWLDLGVFCQKSLPKNTIHRIRYFTARVSGSPTDPGKPQRQDIYLRALRTIPHLSIHYGTFLTHPRIMPLAHPPQGGPYTAEVIRTDEKGSDVNLAAFLLLDGFRQDYEVAVVVSNDSDLATPMEMVRRELGLRVGALNPQANHAPAIALKRAATFFSTVQASALADSQFPATFNDQNGQIHKPKEW